MQTNKEALKEVARYYVQHKNEIKGGYMHIKEIEFITKAFGLKEKNLIQLHDARDYAVAGITNSALITHSLEQDDENEEFFNDLRNAITFIIDSEILTRGGRL